MADNIPVNNDLFVPTTDIKQGTFCKVVSNRTVALCLTTDADTDVAGIFMVSRKAGGNTGVPVLTAEGYQVDVLCTGLVNAGDRISLSTTTAGYCMKSLPGAQGVGECVQGGTNTTITIIFEGNAGSSVATSAPVPLLAYNLTTAPITLFPTAVVLPVSSQPGLRGPAVDVTAAFSALTPVDFAALELQANPGGENPLNVQYEWNGLPGYPTPGLAAGTPDTFIAEDDFLVWVSPTGVPGAGGTPSNPTTITDFFQRMPSLWRKRCQMIQLPGVYNWPSLKNNTAFDVQIGQPVGNTGTPFLILGDLTNEQGNRTSDNESPSDSSISDSTLAMGPDQYRRFFLTIYDAFGVPLQSREIIGNNATTIFVNDKFSPPAAAGDIFRIEQPSVINTLNDPSGLAFLFSSNSGPWGQKGIHWHTDVNFNLVVNGRGNFSTERCMYTSGGEGGTTLSFLTFSFGALGVFSSLGGPWGTDDFNPFADTRAQAAATCNGFGIVFTDGATAHLSSYLIMDNSNGFGCLNGSNVEALNQFNSRGGVGIIVTDAKLLVIADSSKDPIAATVENLFTEALFIEQNGIVDAVFGENVWKNNAGSAIAVQSGGILDFLFNTSGAGNGDVGVDIRPQGQVKWFGAAITLTGVNGDVRVGNRPVAAWAGIGITYPAPSIIWDIREPMFKPFRVDITQGAADTIDLTSFGFPAAIGINTLRTTAAASVLGSYLTTDSGGTLFDPGPLSDPGTASLSDDGHTITFKAGSQVTKATIEYIPVDAAQYTGAQLANNAI